MCLCIETHTHTSIVQHVGVDRSCRPWVTEMHVLPFSLQLSSLPTVHLTFLSIQWLFFLLSARNVLSASKKPQPAITGLLSDWRLRWQGSYVVLFKTVLATALMEKGGGPEFHPNLFSYLFSFWLTIKFYISDHCSSKTRLVTIKKVYCSCKDISDERAWKSILLY